MIKYKIKINIPFLHLCQSTQFQHQALLGNSQCNEVEKSANAQKMQKQIILFIWWSNGHAHVDRKIKNVS